VRALLALGANIDTAWEIRSENSREEEEEKKMARRKLTLRDQIKGVRAAIKSRRTPPQLVAGLKKREEWLKKRIRPTA
jgi:hypothetical protein